MNCIFMLIDIAFQHRIGANSVTDCMRSVWDIYWTTWNICWIMGYVLRAQSKLNIVDLTVCDILV